MAGKSSNDTSPGSRGRGRVRHGRFWLVAGAFAGAVLLWMAARVLLLFFTGVLLAAFLSGISNWICRRTRLSYRWSLTLVITGLLGAAALTGFLLAPEMADQFGRLANELPKAWRYLQEQLQGTEWGRRFLGWLPELPKSLSQIPSGISRATGFLSSALGALANVVILFFVGLYLAVEPKRYAEGIVRLCPPEKRDRARAVMDTLGTTLQRWLLGRLLLMAVNTVVTALGLWWMGVPLPVTLGILSGLLNFVPNIGPIVAAVPAVLLAFVNGPWMALYVLVFYFAYQMIDGYVLTPLVQRRTVLIPPALIIMSQVLLGVLVGAMGVVLAVPLLAMALVLVKMLYIEDVLGERADLPG